jgi:formimidoylglutamate deiminase
VTEKDLADTTTTYVPDLLYLNGRFERDLGLACDPRGRVVAVLPLHLLRNQFGGHPRAGESYDVTISGKHLVTRFVRLSGRAMLPGMVNAHSHAFQRVIRGRTEYRSTRARDSFWTWREMMYAAAERLTPEDIYDASRMAFLEMTLAGITSVGEFHYLHRTPEGSEYEDPNLLSKEVVRAALDVGLRIALLRVAYARSGFDSPPDVRQLRFIEPEPEIYIRNTEALIESLSKDETDARHATENVDADTYSGGAHTRAWVGVAPHSIRAVPIDYIFAVNDFAVARKLPLHMHVAEQPAEIEACLLEWGCTPLVVLGSEGVLGPHFTGVHVIHFTEEFREVQYLKKYGGNVCACPTTERNLGDGIVPADMLFDAGIPVALGTDSNVQIDLLEDARELEYHLRLQRLQRNVLAHAHTTTERVEARRDEGRVSDGEAMRDPASDSASDAARDTADSSDLSTLAARLFECASVSGARSIGADAGEFVPGSAADFFTVDLNDASIAGASAEDLLPSIVFSLSRAAVRDVCVGGRLVIEDGRHAAHDRIVSRFAALQQKLWSEM